MSSFARYIGIDYSGAETPTAGLKGLRVYLAEGDAPPFEVLPAAESSQILDTTGHCRMAGGKTLRRRAHAGRDRPRLFISAAVFRRHQVDGLAISEAAAAFGVTRPTFYKAQNALQAGGLPSLLPGRRGPSVERRENIIAVGSSGTGKTHVGLGLGLAACQKGLSVGFTTAAALAHELIEARDEKRLLRLQRQYTAYKLLIIDELGYVPLSQTGAELLFEVFSQRYERGATLVTSNLPFDEWTSVFGSERLTGALLDRLTHHVHILEMNGESYRLAQSKRRSRRSRPDTPVDETASP